MAFTRNQAKQQQQKQRSQNTNTNTTHYIPIDFIDASIEWRKNKVKRENCTFEYIYI